MAVAESFRNQFNQIYWRIKANNKIYYIKSNDAHAWIKDPDYYESIINVIGEAIGDCVTRKNEFQDKELSDVITFAAEPEGYGPEHWNAVVLYNLVEYTRRVVRYARCQAENTLYAEPATLDQYKEISFDQIQKDLLQHYTEYYEEHNYHDRIQGLKDSIGRAINDIKQYDEALNLTDTLKKVMQTAYTYDFPSTPAGMIKTFRKYYKRAKDQLKWAQSYISLARTKAQDLIDHNEQEIAKQIALKNNQDPNYSKDTVDQLRYQISDSFYRWQATLDDLAKSQNKEYQPVLQKYEPLVSQSDEELYRSSSITAKLINDIDDILHKMSRGLNPLRNIGKDDTMRYIQEGYTRVFGSKDIYSEMEQKKPDFTSPLELQDQCNINLAPELKLEPIHEALGEPVKYDYNKLYFTECLASQFENCPGYKQETYPMLHIESIRSGPLLARLIVRAPVRETLEPLQTTEIDKTALFKKRCRYDQTFRCDGGLHSFDIPKNARYILDRSQDTLFDFGNSRDHNDTRLYLENSNDQICGSTLRLLAGLIDKWPY